MTRPASAPSSPPSTGRDEIRADTWMALAARVAHAGQFPGTLDFSLLMGAIAFAGAGGGQNLVSATSTASSAAFNE